MNRQNRIIQVVKNPEIVKTYDLRAFDLLKRQAQAADLLAYLQFLFEQHDLLAELPDKFLEHMETARYYANAQHRAVLWEVDRIEKALSSCDIPVIFLKGAAYQLSQIPFSKTRIFSDIDILVPKQKLESVENALSRNGWSMGKVSAYDQRYYRQWMHEIPPMRHLRRNTVIDVHHTILPETSRLHPDPGQLMSESVKVPDWDNVFVLAPVDMVLHSATHLLHEGEFHHALRDLVDLHEMIKFFSTESIFWQQLYERAKQQQLLRPLYYAILFINKLFGTSIPQWFMQKIEKSRAIFPINSIMTELFLIASTSIHDSCTLPGNTLASWLLYIRGHYLRMPLYLLVPHLLRKSFVSEK
ncbi:MAG: nucleotidyltransferase family protein [Gammaproteobacteria bacterium]|nr:nucleotidyltransferase family protein [Gammaproteobacteria bacterium]